MRHETAGDPMTGLKWTRKTTEKIAEELSSLEIHLSPNTVGRLLKKMDFSLRVNHKKLSSGSRSNRDERDEQFIYIARLKEKFMRGGHPAVSVDTKKRSWLATSRIPVLLGINSQFW